MKRTPLKRGRRRTLTAEEREQATLFKLSVAEMPCAVCGLHRYWPDAHHVVEKQELESRGLPLYDPRNALPLCPINGGPGGCDAHEAHTNRSRPVPFRKLRAENIAYAYEVLGDFAGDYLKRRYPMDETKGQS